ncbi:O-succinylbenzoate synthase [Syntrophus gentianae]|uniref:O-succinylbenzoate synthase n=2 Tax=Syntrophus gentianae TaxID=43775 RepID=A0A1H7VTT2_9BACT|nr:O-succinylbenzoate synthase [Syntrophus gentianae]
MPYTDRLVGVCDLMQETSKYCSVRRIRMRIIRTEVYRFSLPFAAPLKVGRVLLQRREGLLISLTDDYNHCSYGEIAPLAGFDSTTLERCLQDIPDLGNFLNNAGLFYDRFEITAPLLGIVDCPVSSWAGHTLFGVESALLGLYLQARGKDSLKDLFRLPNAPMRIPVNALFIPESTEEGLDRQIRDLKNSGATTFKIKIGRLPENEEIRQIRWLVDEMGSGICLRLDGNRNLTPAAYHRYFEALCDLPVEYVEEPLALEELERAGDVPWPLALDESLTRFLDPEEPRLSALDPAVRTVILKPGLLRGLHAMARAVKDAEHTGIRTIFSSAFNSGISLAILGVFSRLVGLPPETVHGLDTLRYLAADILQPSPSIRGGKLEIPDRLLFGGASLNPSCIGERVL